MTKIHNLTASSNIQFFAFLLEHSAAILKQTPGGYQQYLIINTETSRCISLKILVFKIWH